MVTGPVGKRLFRRTEEHLNKSRANIWNFQEGLRPLPTGTFT